MISVRGTIKSRDIFKAPSLQENEDKWPASAETFLRKRQLLQEARTSGSGKYFQCTRSMYSNQ